MLFIDELLVKQGDIRFVWSNAPDQEDTVIASQRLRQSKPCELNLEAAWTSCTVCGAHRGDQKSRMQVDETEVKLQLDLDDPRTMVVQALESQPKVFEPRVQQLEPSGAYTGKGLGFFSSKDAANRVAKAYIHAMVLCHKPEASSLF